MSRYNQGNSHCEHYGEANLSYLVTNGIDEMGQAMQEADKSVSGSFPETKVLARRKIVLIQRTSCADTLKNSLADWLWDNRDKVGTPWRIKIVKRIR